MSQEPDLSTSVAREPRAFALRKALLATAILICLFGGMVALLGWTVYRRALDADTAAATRYVASVADMKIRQIREWREERRRDAEYLTLDPAFARQIAQLRGPHTAADVAGLRRRVTVLFRSEEYLHATLLRPDGSGPLADGFWMPGAQCQAFVARAVSLAQPTFGQIERGPDGEIHLDVAAPVRDIEGPGVVAVLVVQINPRPFLYQAVGAWPGESDTAETLLLRKEGDKFVVLNDARHRGDAALRLTVPLASPLRPAGRLTGGERREVRAVDYRGVEVIAAVRQVSGTPWTIISKIDRDEAVTGTRDHAGLLFAALAALVALAAATGGVGVFSMQSRFYRRQYRAAAEREAMLQRHAAELEAADGRLRESEERLRLALTGSAAALYIQDADLRYVWIYNPLHFPREEIVGRTDEDLFGESGRALRALKRHVVQSRVPARQETALDVHGAVRFFDVTIEPLLAGDTVVGVRGVTIDVTDRHQLEDQLRQAQKLEAVGQLAGGVAHDFNNLLTAINGYTELVLSELAKDDPHRSDLAQVQNAGSRAASLTRQLLAFSRKQVLQPEPVEINALITQTSTMLRRIIGEDVQLQLALGPAACVFADPGQLEQILLNLCVNSRDAMPGGGRITIQTSRVDGPRVRIVVADTGTGIAPDVLPHIFEPFFTTKDRDRGTGLGLATVYGVVQQSGGTIDVKTVVGQGATFILEFPEWSGAPASGAPVKRAGQGTESILIVEDDHPVRALAEQILVRAGYRVVSVASGAEGIALAARERFDLLLTDIVMADMDGRAVSKALLAVSPDTRVLYMSGYAPSLLANRGVDGSVRLLQKPFSMLTLTSAVRDALDAAPTTT